ncbi:MAG: hypothetical protein WA733_05395 [Methylocystis sp.]
MKDAASDSVIQESTRKLRAMFGLDQPEPKEKKGVDALAELIGIGLWCKMGLGLNEQQRQFLSSLADNLEDKLRSGSAVDAVVDVLGLEDRKGGGGAAHQWRQLRRRREAARRLFDAWFNDPAIMASDAIRKVARDMKVSPDTVKNAVRKSDFPELLGMPRRRRGRPSKLPKGRE